MLRARYPKKPLGQLCTLFGRSRQGFYKKQKTLAQNQFAAAFALELVQEVRAQHPQMGTLKIHHILTPKFREHGIRIGRDKLFNLLAYRGMLIKPKRRKSQTTNSLHPFKKYPDLAKEMEVTRIEQLWVADITYIRLLEGFCYLSLLTDAFSRLIVGYRLWPSLHTEGPLKALEMALENRQNTGVLTHHSDRGIQYCSSDYVAVAQGVHIDLSMSQDGSPYDNALAERMNGILKQEYSLGESFIDYQAACRQVSTAVECYNKSRPHLSLSMATPWQVHRSSHAVT